VGQTVHARSGRRGVSTVVHSLVVAGDADLAVAMFTVINMNQTLEVVTGWTRPLCTRQAVCWISISHTCFLLIVIVSENWLNNETFNFSLLALLPDQVLFTFPNFLMKESAVLGVFRLVCDWPLVLPPSSPSFPWIYLCVASQRNSSSHLTRVTTVTISGKR